MLLRMATTVVMRNSINFGVRFPKETINKLDQLKGKYDSRNRFLLKIVDEYLTAQGERIDKK